MKKITLLIFSAFVALQVCAQREAATWLDYLSYANAIKVADAGDKIYCATEGGLFYLDRDDNSLSKVSDLSGFGIQTMAYNSDEDLLLVAYSDANIDIVSDGEVVNLSDIQRKSTTADKTIYNISFNNSEAYISCGFGIVVINLDKNEVKDTYIIGDNGETMPVYDVDFYMNRIYAATEEGIFWAPEDDDNLLDYANWIEDTDVPYAGEPFTLLAVHSGVLIANYSDGEATNDQAFAYDGTNWTSYYSSLDLLLDLQSNNNYLCITGKHKVVLYDEAHSNVGEISGYQFGDEEVSYIYSYSATVSEDGTIWIADYEDALVSYQNSAFESMCPNGPSSNDVFDLEIVNSTVYVAPGGRTDDWNNSYMEPRVERLGDGVWSRFSEDEFPEITDFWDIVCVAVDPFDDNHFFAGSWGGGLLEFKDDELVNHYTNNNSPLESALPSQPDDPYVRIGGLDFDSEGNLWITNTALTANNLHKLSPAGDWESFTMEEVTNLTIGQVLVTENDDKWILVPRGNDAYVVDETGDNMKQLLVTSYFSNGSDEYTTRMNDVYAIAEDQDGEIWIGTSQGVAVYSYPENIWSSETFYASQPGLDLDDGIYYPLLSTETVTAIAVDGANRKWIGTSGSGVYLISESGDEELLHFTEDNSSLLSDNIYTIAIDDNTGEVFFGTENGLISYQGDATGGSDNYSDVYVYPNPVRETYDGTITITGLITETDIKITDIAGNLVYTTTSTGGQATWDGKNLNGKRVKTGVYLVFCNDQYGDETHITKLLFIH